jgi:hypothetical protein
MGISLSLAVNANNQVTLAFVDGEQETIDLKPLLADGLASLLARARG